MEDMVSGLGGRRCEGPYNVRSVAMKPLPSTRPMRGGLGELTRCRGEAVMSFYCYTSQQVLAHTDEALSLGCEFLELWRSASASDREEGPAIISNFC